MSLDVKLSRASAPPEDVSLIRAVARGEEHAVTTLYRMHVDALFGFVYRRVRDNREDAEEIVQDTFLTVLKLAASYRGESTAFSWLCGLARLKIVDYHRRNGRDKRIPKAMISSYLEVEQKAAGRDPYSPVEASMIVDLLLQGLCPDEQEALIMRYVDGLSLREIASILGRTERAIDALLDRAKKKQRDQLRRWWGQA